MSNLGGDHVATRLTLMFAACHAVTCDSWTRPRSLASEKWSSCSGVPKSLHRKWPTIEKILSRLVSSNFRDTPDIVSLRQMRVLFQGCGT